MKLEHDTDSAGFTLLEVMAVCAIVAVLAMISYPNMVRFSQQQNTKQSATQMAGVLDSARSRAVSEATPHLVFINPKAVNGSGNCGPVATIVRDSDRSYSLTPGDQVRDVELDPSACKDAHPFGDGGPATDADIPLPSEDLAVRGLAATGEELGEEDEGEDEGEDEDETSGAQGNGNGNGNGKLADVVVNGATFPLDADSGRPVIAFSERGIPVDPENPTRWGGGAGAVYVTDRHGTVYAVVVQPLGDVSLRVYDHVKGSWR